MRLSFLLATLAALSLPASAQKMQTPAGEAPGPWLLATIGVGKQPDGTMKTTAIKGLAIKLSAKGGTEGAKDGAESAEGGAAVAYDLDLCRLAGAWTGKFTTPMNLMSRGEYPTVLGDVAFTSGSVPGFLQPDAPHSAGNLIPFGKERRFSSPGALFSENQPGKSGFQLIAAPAPPEEPPFSKNIRLLPQWTDPRAEPFGPLPKGQARFRGFHVNGSQVIIRWEIGGREVLELPGYNVVVNGGAYFTRTFYVPPGSAALQVLVGGDPQPDGPIDVEAHRRLEGEVLGLEGKERIIQSTPWLHGPHGEVMVWAAGDPDGSKWRQLNGDLALEIPPLTKAVTFQLAYWTAPASDPDGRTAPLFFREPDVDLPALLKQSTAQWPETVTTAGELSKDTDSAYVVDTIKLPDPNPWNAPLFVGGFDFLPDGRVAICTFHGDVFIGSGIDAGLEKVTWKRFASGLYHALGLKVVNGEIYVTCRDGLWRLRDVNGTGEADSYEAFNFDLKATTAFHEFVFDLQTDPEGNFYFAKAGPVKNGGRGFDEIMAHHGAMFCVSPDGAKFEVIATGFRAPNGIGCGPHGELTSGDNEGTWTPVCRLNWIKPGGFYGVVPLSHRDPAPTSYDLPLCWMPKRVDNSSGGQVWAPDDDRWGPWRGQLLHLSYGTCSVFGVLKEEVDTPQGRAMQGGVTRFPLTFQSGIMRARFSPKDGQLYVAGLRGWQTTATKNGCLQRVRYTGKETRMPIELHVKKGGIELHFTCPLDTQAARDPENWHLEQWRYLWSSAYGSPELSTVGDDAAPGEQGKDGSPQFTAAQMTNRQHDQVTVKSVSIGTDERTVFLEIPGLKPVMQMSIKYELKTADGQELRGEVVNTIHAPGED